MIQLLGFEDASQYNVQGHIDCAEKVKNTATVSNIGARSNSPFTDERKAPLQIDINRHPDSLVAATENDGNITQDKKGKRKVIEDEGPQCKWVYFEKRLDKKSSDQSINALQPTSHACDNAHVSFHRNAPIQLFGSPRVPRENILEKSGDKAADIKNEVAPRTHPCENAVESSHKHVAMQLSGSNKLYRQIIEEKEDEAHDFEIVHGDLQLSLSPELYLFKVQGHNEGAEQVGQIATDSRNGARPYIPVMCKEETRRAHCEIDLNHPPDNPVAAAQNDKTIICKNNRKDKVIEDKNEESLDGSNEKDLRYLPDTLLAATKKHERITLEKKGKERAIPDRKDGSVDTRNYIDLNHPPLSPENAYPQFECGSSSQCHQPENYVNYSGECPRVSANGTSETTDSNVMAALAVTAKFQYRRDLLWHAERKVWNSSNINGSHHVGIPAFPVSPSNYRFSGTNNCQISYGNSLMNMMSVSHQRRIMDSWLLPGTSAYGNGTQNFAEWPLLINANLLPQFPGFYFAQSGMSSPSWGSSNWLPGMQLSDYATEWPLSNNADFIPQFPGFYFGQSWMSSPSWGFSNWLPGMQLSGYASQSSSFGKEAGTQGSKLMNAAMKSGEAERQKSKQLTLKTLDSPRHGQVRHSSRPIELDLNRTDYTQTCTINKNPSDITLPEDENEYMIGHKDLKRRKRKTVSGGYKKRRSS